MSKARKMAINFELLKVNKMTSLKIYISSHEEARNIKFGEQINFILRVRMGTPTQEEVTSSPPDHMTLRNLLISSYRGAVIKCG